MFAYLHPSLRVINMYGLHLHARIHVLQAVSHVVIGRLVLHGHLDAVGQEAEDGTDPEQDGEAAE